MASFLRRYELLLPMSSDGYASTLEELECCYARSSPHAMFRQEGLKGRTDLARVFVDVPDTPANREFFVAYKEKLRERFRQPISMTTYVIELL